MRVAEVELNKTVAFRANDREHKAFKLACIENDEEMAEVLRQFMRDYVKRQAKRK